MMPFVIGLQLLKHNISSFPSYSRISVDGVIFVRCIGEFNCSPKMGDKKACWGKDGEEEGNKKRVVSHGAMVQAPNDVCPDSFQCPSQPNR